MIESSEFRVENYAHDNLNPFDRKESVIPRVEITAGKRLSLLQQASSLCPTNGEALYRLGHIYHLMGYETSANESWLHAWARSSRTPTASPKIAFQSALSMAWLYRTRGHPDQALAWIDSAECMQPHMDDLHVLRSLAHADLGLASADGYSPDATFTVARFGHGKIKMSLPARWAAATWHIFRNELPIAAGLLDDYKYDLRRAPNYLRWYWNDYGSLNESLSRYAEAAGCYKREWESIPERFNLPLDTWRGRGEFLGIDGCDLPFSVNSDWEYVSGSRFCFAVQSLLKAEDMPDIDGLAFRRRAYDSLTVCLRRNIRKAEALLVMAYCESRGANTRAALNSVSAAIQLKLKERERAYAFGLRGILYRELDDFALAVNDLDQAIAINPTLAFAWNALGACHADMGQYDLAARSFFKALALDSGADDARYNLGALQDASLGRGHALALESLLQSLLFELRQWAATLIQDSRSLPVDSPAPEQLATMLSTGDWASIVHCLNRKWPNRLACPELKALLFSDLQMGHWDHARELLDAGGEISMCVRDPAFWMFMSSLYRAHEENVAMALGKDALDGHR